MEREPLLPRTNAASQSNPGCQSFGSALKAEFQLKKLSLHFPREDVFFQSQWDWPPIVFLLYRLGAAAYTSAVLVIGIVHFSKVKWELPWPVFLTNWSYALLTLHLLLSAAIVLMETASRRVCCRKLSLRSSVHGNSAVESDAERLVLPDGSLCWYLKLNRLVFSVAASAAVTVTLLYFIALYPVLYPDGGPLDWEDVNVHLMNSVIVVLELSLSAIPVQLMHAVYPLVYGLAYALFSVLYWAADHSHVIYPKVLDWNQPLLPALLCLSLAFVGIPLLQFLLFACYRLRVWLYCKIYGP